MLGVTDGSDDNLVMLACPVPGCDAKRGPDYWCYADHLYTHHGPEDIGLTAGADTIQTRLIADGGNP